MKTKISLKDVVVNEEDMHYQWDLFCKKCRYFSEFNTKRCSACQPRIAPPTRWRAKK